MAEDKDYGAIYLCQAKGCGDVAGRSPKIYCALHTTAESRKKLIEENAEVQKEWDLKYPNGYEANPTK